MPIDFASLVAVAQTCFLALESLEKGASVDYVDPEPTRPIA